MDTIDKRIKVGRRKHFYCTIPSCNKKHWARGYCHNHYRFYMLYGDPNHIPYSIQNGRPKKTTITICKGPECNKKAVANKLCKAHWDQQHKGHALTPLNKYVKAKQDENGRVCTDCFEYKEWTEYYKRGNGTYNASCKKCMKKKQREYMARKRDNNATNSN